MEAVRQTSLYGHMRFYEEMMEMVSGDSDDADNIDSGNDMI